MSAFLSAMPLADVTNTRMSLGNTLPSSKKVAVPETPQSRSPFDMLSQEVFSPLSDVPSPLFHTAADTPTPVRVRQNDPYSWNVLPNRHMEMMVAPPVAAPLPMPVIKDTPLENFTVYCRCLVQFKCHHAEYASPIALMKGQYVVVHGDRGIDVGVVIRINTEENKQYVERTGPAGSVIRHATQREVDYWATELKADEQAALDYCRTRLAKHALPMEIRHAEYQFDKKKLTFYYESKTRVDFVTLLKELFREFSCRIWMEKVRVHE
jgi:hypothetical protein